jgi:hypothetical protein
VRAVSTPDQEARALAMIQRELRARLAQIEGQA